MSTKIWQASRVPIEKLNDYLVLCRSESMGRVVTKAYELLKKLDWDKFAPEVVVETEKKIKDWGITNLERQRMFRNSQMIEHLGRGAFRDATNKLERSLFDMESSFNIWIDETYAYLIPYGLAELPVTSYSEDFHYQNSTDKPEHISQSEWDARHDKWEQLCLNNWNATRLQYTAIDFSGTSWIESIGHLLDAMKLSPEYMYMAG